MKFPALVSLLVLFAGTALAGPDIRTFDRNGDRFVTYDELIAVAPGATRSDFRAIDRNGDRRVSADELSSARALAIVARLEPGEPSDATGLVPLRPASVSDIDTDRDGRISFDELYRTDRTSLTSLRGN